MDLRKCPAHSRVLQTLGSDWRIYKNRELNEDKCFRPLGQIKWHRVILDVSP